MYWKPTILPETETNDMKSPMIFAIAMALAAVAADVQAQQTPIPLTTAPVAAAPAATTAPTAPVAPKAGDVVYDTEGVVAGSVVSVAGPQVILSTDQGKAAMATSYLTMGNAGLTIALSKAQLEAAIIAAKAAPRAGS